MKRLLSLLVLGILLLASCGQAQADSEQSVSGGSQAASGGEPAVSADVAEQPDLVVYTSIYPLYDFATQIAGDKAQVRLLVPEGSDPHVWGPTPTDRVSLQNAGILIYNGAGLEHWVDAVLAAMPKDSFIAVETSAGLTLLEGEGGDHGHDHGVLDPHVWLDPGNAISQCDTILAVLLQADPENGAYYEQRHQMYTDELRQLDQRYREALAPYRGSSIVVAHEAFGYLCHAYGLEQVGVQGFNPEGDPDPAQMAAMITFVRENDVKVIFFEAQAGPAVAQTIARETGVEILLLDPLETLSSQRRQQGENYITGMDENLQALLLALE